MTGNRLSSVVTGIIAFLVALIFAAPLLNVNAAPVALAAPSVLNYSLELAVIVVGYVLILLIVLWRYQRS